MKLNLSNSKEKSINENDIDIERLIIIFDFLNKKENKSKEYKFSEFLEQTKGIYKRTLNILKKDISDLKKIYVDEITPPKRPATITFRGLDLDRRKLIKLKNPDYKLVLEILNGYFSSPKNSSFSILSDLQDFYDLKPKGVIDFDSSEKQLEIVNNKDFLLKIIEAIENEKQIKITLKDNNQKIYCSPSLIKVFNKRWYLIGVESPDVDGEKNKYKTVRFRFNDILKIEECAKSSIEKRGKMKIETSKYFKNRIGVSFEHLKHKKIVHQGNIKYENCKYDNEVEHTILLKIDMKYYEKYFKDKPLFSEELNLNDDEKDIELEGKFKLVKGKLKINKELVTALFSYKSYVEVLEPKFLRDHMIEIIKELNEMYGVANNK